MDKNDYDLLDGTRHAAIDAAANLLEAADHAKRLRKRLSRASCWEVTTTFSPFASG
jgi:hypothetical protein